MHEIYMDYATTTPVRREVLDAMLPYFESRYGNPSALYQHAAQAKYAIEQARRQVAVALGVTTGDVFFTSGGTESDNWALVGVADAYAPKGGHLITSAIEHHAVLHTCQYLERRGYDVTYLPVDSNGMVSLQSVKTALRKDTFLISIMLANNEIGTIQPVADIAAVAKAHSILMHTDAVQAVGHIPVDVHEMGVDLLSLSGHKFYGPKGVGALYIRKGVVLEPLLHGGAQEYGMRAGTQHVAGIVGLGQAITLACEELWDEASRLQVLRDYFVQALFASIPDIRLNGHMDARLPGNLNLSFAGVDKEALLMLLDAKGVAASAGAACTSGALEPSHVLRALGIGEAYCNSAVRLTMGRGTTQEDIDSLLLQLPKMVARLRSLQSQCI